MSNYKSMVLSLLISVMILGCKSNPVITQKKTPKNSHQAQTHVSHIDLPKQDSINHDVDSEFEEEYHAEVTKKFDLIHTDLEVNFDWKKQQLNGIAVLTMKPWFYEQSEVRLDAKFFTIHQIELVNKSGKKRPLQYNYVHNNKLIIKLDKTYQSHELLTLRIKYTAHPNQGNHRGSASITDDKGLYFINPLGNDQRKPQQIWTQGETESSSRWFPTFDAPNTKTTQTIKITVADQYVTLSNGKLVSSKKHQNGMRTDIWKQEKPHAPYLFMMAIGKFTVIKDQWNGKEISYYVEPKYATHARAVFGNTPEMMTFFSELLDYPFPWEKYAQVVVRDFVSGAMENTSASVFNEGLNTDTRSMLDGNWDQIIAHELFHQWFGDLVTCESWANLPLNESFANYAEYLWLEHKYGKPTADAMLSEELTEYLDEAKTKQEPLIRYHYADKEDMFDSHSYSKGCVILHHFRHVIGDKAFFEGLRRYLKKYAYQKAEIHDLRLIFEDVTGEDLNWFFNQWFMKSGHPNLLVTDEYKDGQVIVKVVQRQDTQTTPIYRLPVVIDIWQNDKKISHHVWITKKTQEFRFSIPQKPEVVIFDATTHLPAIVEHLKTPDAFMAQVRYSDQLLVRSPAVKLLMRIKDQPKVEELFIELLDDKTAQLRRSACIAFEDHPPENQSKVAEKLQKLALHDTNPNVRAAAVGTLGKFGKKYTHFFEQTMKDSSYSVLVTSIYAHHNSGGGVRTIKKIEQYEKLDNIGVVITLGELYVNYKTPNKENWFIEKINHSNGTDLPYILNYFGQYLMKIEDKKALTKSVDYLTKLALIAGNYKVRIGCYQALALIMDAPELDIKSKMKTIRDKETHSDALEAYRLFGD